MAISQGNELIKTEVLIKLQRARQQAAGKAPPEPAPAPGPAPQVDAKKARRKRKISDKERREGSDQALAPPEPPARPPNVPKNESDKGTAESSARLEPVLYKNVNYRKFYYNDAKARKQPKMIFKKQK